MTPDIGTFTAAGVDPEILRFEIHVKGIANLAALFGIEFATSFYRDVIIEKLSRSYFSWESVSELELSCQ